MKKWQALPEPFIERLEKIIPKEHLAAALESFCNRRPTTFRTNLLKTTTEQLGQELTKLGFETETVSWYKDAFILKNKSKKELIDTDLYANGHLYVQSLSSMIPPLVLDPKTNEAICDLTAAPGSKTTQMAAMMGNSGEIVANDKSRIRLYKLQANLKIQGVTNTKVTYIPGQIFWQKYPEYFDKTLLDAPCSLEGMMQVDDLKSYEDWSMKRVKFLVEIQRFLLRAAISATRPGGTIIYSTCTLTPEENEGVLDWILKREGNAVELEKIDFTIPEQYAPIKHWNTKDYNPAIQNSLRVLPTSLMEGFFVAKIRKIRSNISLTR